MSKVFLVSESWGTCDDSSYVGAFLDEEKADKYIEERMIPRNEELKQHKKCQKCRCCNDLHEVFLLENTCPIAKIGTDRNGKYCENDISEFYNIKTNNYWKSSVNIIE